MQPKIYWMISYCKFQRKYIMSIEHQQFFFLCFSYRKTIKFIPAPSDLLLLTFLARVKYVIYLFWFYDRTEKILFFIFVNRSQFLNNKRKRLRFRMPVCQQFDGRLTENLDSPRLDPSPWTINSSWSRFFFGLSFSFEMILKTKRANDHLSLKDDMLFILYFECTSRWDE